MMFERAYNLTDDELNLELERYNDPQIKDVLESDKVSDYVKNEILEHYHDVVAEKSKRESDSWVYPVSNFLGFPF